MKIRPRANMKHFSMELNPEVSVTAWVGENRVAVVGTTLTLCFTLVLVGIAVGITQAYGGVRMKFSQEKLLMNPK